MTLDSCENRYKRIIGMLCRYKGIDDGELEQILKDKDCKCMLFLLLRKYDCIDVGELNKDFSINSKRRIAYNIKKAEEKLLLNKKFRQSYFEAEEMIENCE